MAISLKRFIEKYTGVSADVPWSPQYNNFRGECVSLIVRYLNECFDTPMKARGNAKDYSYSLVNEGIAKKVDKPQYGDIIVYGKDTGGGYGHVQVYINDKQAFDQNNNGDRTAKVRTLLSYAKPIAYVRMNTALVPDEKPVEKQELLFKVGDTVEFTGQLFGNSLGNNPGSTRENHVDKITLINDEGSHPYHIGNLGWVKVSAVSAVTKPSEPSTPKKEYIQLSKEVERWRFYTKQPFTVGNETAFLLPSYFGGLEYEVLEKIPNFVRIKTRDYGEGYIYFDNNTAHSFITK